MTILAALLTLLLQAPKAGIEGFVSRAGTGQPIPAARLTLLKVESAKGVIAPDAADKDTSATAAVSGRDGKFLFEDLDEGYYRVVIQANGYVAQFYDRQSRSAEATPIHLRPGQKLKDLNIQLTPAGDINGHVLDRSGQPLADVPVQLLRYSYNALGQREYQTANSGKTNDRGEYRLYWIMPGRYYLIAGRPAPAGSRDQDQNVDAFELTYYPGVADAASATAIEIDPAAELSGFDLKLAPQKLYRVRGRVVDSQTGQPPPTATIEAFLQSPVADPFTEREFSKQGRYDAASGIFEISDLAPGRYDITAVLQDSEDMRPILAGAKKGYFELVSLWRSAASPVGSIAVDVSGADVDGLAIDVFPPVSIRGRFRTEGPEAGIALDNFSIVLTSTAPKPGALRFYMPINESTIAARTESTWIETVPPREYHVTAEGLAGNAYIKEVSLDGVDILNKPLQLSSTLPDRIEVVVSFNAGQITGILKDDRQEAAPAAQVVLVPDRRRDRVDLYKTARTDSTGRFTISGIPPGDYKMFSWQSVEPYGWFDPQILEQAEARGRPVHVLERSSQDIELKIIPAGGGR